MRIDSSSVSALTKMSAQPNTVKAVSGFMEPSQDNSESSSSVQEHEKKQQGNFTMDNKEWVDMINKANKALEGPHTIAEYSVHDETNVIMVKIIDKETHKVIKEFPPEKILDMAARMWEIAGIIVDERR